MDGTLQSNADTEDAQGKTVKNMAALFGDATGTFVAYSWQILGQLDLADLTNTKDLLIALTYGTAGHPYGNVQNAKYASNEEPAEAHFSLEEVHGALSLDITNGLRGYHIPACYAIPEKVVAVKVSAGYSQKNGAYVNYSYYDGADTSIEGGTVTAKNTALLLLAKAGTYDFVLSAALYNQTMTNGNAMNPGMQAGLNTGTTSSRACLRFVNDGTRTGFERNSDANYTVTLDSKDEVYLLVSTDENKFWGNFEWESEAKNWISYKGKTWEDYADKYNSDGITTVPSTLPSSDRCYDLSGRRIGLQSLYKGLYIVNGKKVIR